VTERVQFIQNALKQAHDIETTHVESVPIREMFKGETVWEGVVEVFDVNGHPHAKRAYGWQYEEKGEVQYATVLGVIPINSPLGAVRAYIASQARRVP
jgi:hypothetical protein